MYYFLQFVDEELNSVYESMSATPRELLLVNKDAKVITQVIVPKNIYELYKAQIPKKSKEEKEFYEALAKRAFLDFLDDLFDSFEDEEEYEDEDDEDYEDGAQE